MQVLASAIARRVSAGPTWSDVLFLMPMETDFVDVKNGTPFNPIGSPVVSNAVNAAPFGTNSGQFFDGGFLALANFNLPEDAWTVEFWVNSTFDQNASPAVNRVIASLPRLPDAKPNYFSLTNGSVQFQYYNEANSSWEAIKTSSNSGDQITSGVPNHVAIVKNGTNGPYSIFVNGKMASIGGTDAQAHNELYPEGVIGGDPCTNNWLNGSLKDFRITNAVWYTAYFTPPTGPFPQG